MSLSNIEIGCVTLGLTGLRTAPPGKLTILALRHSHTSVTAGEYTLHSLSVGAARSLGLHRAIKFLGYKLAMPNQEGVRFDDVSNVFKEFLYLSGGA
jgi:hypothetical protein